jgi:hypothetical protein
MRLYNIIAINDRDESFRVQMNAYPLTHDEACANLRKISKHPSRRVQLEERVAPRTLPEATCALM